MRATIRGMLLATRRSPVRCAPVVRRALADRREDLADVLLAAVEPA